jgi:site-specific DNA-cytosine methylase
MRVLVACEFSGIVRDAFAARGHEAWSCDLLATERPGLHYRGELRHFFSTPAAWAGFDLMVAHPPCTHLAVSGAKWFSKKGTEQAEALEFVRWLLALPIARIALENPISVISSAVRKPDQIIQPWQFGHGETKATCLWLKNLPKLLPTTQDDSLFLPPTPAGRKARVHLEPPGPDRWKNRSRTLPGIAAAMAEQWG